MTVYLQMLGPFLGCPGNERRPLRLPPGATVRALLDEIGLHGRTELPGGVREGGNRRVPATITVLVDRRLVMDMDTELRDGQEVCLVASTGG